MAKAKTQAPALFAEGEIADAPEPLCEQALAVWNDIAPKAGWPTARFLTESRRRAIKRAVKDYGGIIGWRSHMEKASKNAFLTGKTDKGDKHAKWRPDLDWFLKPATVVKILEDKFPADAEPAAISLAQRMAPTDEWALLMRGYKPKGFWPQGRGPRPEEPGCRVTPSILVAWRTRHNIVVVVPQAETRADKLRGMISSYRRIGNHGRANELEEELAKLEGSHPTLVPHPEAAHLTGTPKEEAFSDCRQNNRVTDIIPEDEPPPWTEIPEGEDSGEVERD